MLDVSEVASGKIQALETLTLPDILLQFALLNRPVPREELEKYVDELSQKCVLSSPLSSSYPDRDGEEGGFYTDIADVIRQISSKVGDSLLKNSRTRSVEVREDGLWQKN